MTDHVYKVVTRHRGITTNGNTVYRSAIVGGNLSVEYTIDKKVYPPIEGSALYAFKTYEHARKFITQRQTMGWTDAYRILECEYERFDKEVDARVSIVSWSAIIDFWHRHKNRGGFSEHHPNIAIPKGTIMCKWLKPKMTALTVKL